MLSRHRDLSGACLREGLPQAYPQLGRGPETRVTPTFPAAASTVRKSSRPGDKDTWEGASGCHSQRGGTACW